jgi:hypothetical protein
VEAAAERVRRVRKGEEKLVRLGGRCALGPLEEHQGSALAGGCAFAHAGCAACRMGPGPRARRSSQCAGRKLSVRATRETSSAPMYTCRPVQA